MRSHVGAGSIKNEKTCVSTREPCCGLKSIVFTLTRKFMYLRTLHPRICSRRTTSAAKEHSSASVGRQLSECLRRTAAIRPQQCIPSHPGVELRANLKSISHRCHFFKVAFVWDATSSRWHLHRCHFFEVAMHSKPPWSRVEGKS